MPEDCLICREQRGDVELPGGPLWDGKHVVGFHVPPIEENPRPYLGHLLITPRRHVPGLEDLSDEEAATLGIAMARIARAMRQTLDLERVYSAVIGHDVPHLHVHLVPRYGGTPAEVAWVAVDEWEGSPHGDVPEITELVNLLREKIGT